MICVQIVKKLFFKLSNFERVRDSLLHFYASRRVQRNGNSDTHHNSIEATSGLMRFYFHLCTATVQQRQHSTGTHFQTMPTELRRLVFPDNEQSLFPGLNRLRLKNQEHPVRFGTGRLFHLSTEDDQGLSQERVFCHEFVLAPGKVCQRPQQERGGVRFCPGDKAVMERLKPNACLLLDEDENPMHSGHYSFVKMSR